MQQGIVRGRNETSAKSLWPFMGAAFCGKLTVNTAKRMMYPFAPAIARGLGVDLGAVTAVIALNQASSLAAPLVVMLSGRIGYRLLLLYALMLFCIAMTAAGLIPVYGIVMAAFLVTGLSKSIIDPVFQAIAGTLVPFEKRGRAIGIMETAWAGSSLAGLPLTGILIERLGWQAPFWLFAALSLACFYAVLSLLPRDMPKTKVPRNRQGKRSLLPETWKTVLKEPAARQMMLFAFFICLANDNLFVVYGIWFEHSFNLSLTAIGFGAVLIGLSEVAGEMFTVFFSDRIGLKRTIISGTLAVSLCYCLLIWTGNFLWPALISLFMVFFTFEFTIVSSMGLATELLPQHRASFLSLYFASTGIGRLVGVISGSFLWEHAGLEGVCILSGTVSLLGLLALLKRPG